MSLTRGQKLNPPVVTNVYEAPFGTPVTVEFRLRQESETSFFDDTLSIDIVVDSGSEVGKFLLLHPWFCKHIVLVWNSRNVTHNVLITDFLYVAQEPNAAAIVGVKIRPIDTLTACHAIEEARQTIQTYDGTEATKLKEKYDARDYFKSGLLPRLDI